jgi:hypothetical protein
MEWDYKMLDELKAQLRSCRQEMPEDNAVRLHRALSWMRSAAGQQENPDLQFISLWIAFNSCYGVDEERFASLVERELFLCAFLECPARRWQTGCLGEEV